MIAPVDVNPIFTCDYISEGCMTHNGEDLWEISHFLRMVYSHLILDLMLKEIGCDSGGKKMTGVATVSLGKPGQC